MVRVTDPVCWLCTTDIHNLSNIRHTSSQYLDRSKCMKNQVIRVKFSLSPSTGKLSINLSRELMKVSCWSVQQDLWPLKSYHWHFRHVWTLQAISKLGLSCSLNFWLHLIKWAKILEITEHWSQLVCPTFTEHSISSSESLHFSTQL